MDFDSIQDVGSAPQAQAPQAAAPSSSAQPSAAPPSFDDIQDAGDANNSMYSTPREQFKAGLEGVGQGVLGPIAPAVEKFFGANPEDIAGRAEANPGTHQLGEAAGLVGGMLTGTGEAALAEHIADAGIKAVGLAGKVGMMGKVASATGKAAIENAVIQGSDETTQMVLNDPNQTAQSAIANIGLAAAIGGGIGGTLGAVSPLWQATKASKFGGVVNDLADRLKFRAENPDRVSHLTDTMQNAYDSIDQGSKMLYENGGLKEQEIRKLLPDYAPSMLENASDLEQSGRSTIAGLQKDIAPQGTINRLTDATDRFQQRALEADQAQDAFKMQDATNKYKQELGVLSKFNKAVNYNGAETDAMNAIRGTWGKLQQNLENEYIWGKAGKVQADVNQAYSELQGPLKQAQSKWMTTVKEASGDVTKVDPGKMNTYLNQLGSPKAELKQDMMSNFLDAHDNFHNTIQKIYDRNGVENPIKQAATGALKETTNELTPGTKLGDWLYDKGLSHAAGSGAGALTGETLGHHIGFPGVGALIGEHALGPIFSKVLPTIAAPLATMASSSIGAKAGIDYVTGAMRGDTLIKRAAGNLFKAEREILPQQIIPDQKDRDKLSKNLATVKENPTALANVGGHVGTYMPDHATAIAQTTAGATNYLNSLKPSTDPAAPLDSKLPVNPVAKATYNRALDIAQQPLMIFKHLRDGTLQPQDVVALKTMYPSLYDKFSSEMTTNMTAHMAKGGTIPYQTRLGMSMFLAQPLDSTMQPASIIAAQMVGQPQGPPAPQGGQPKPSKKGEEGLSKLAQTYQTPSQKREQSRSES